MVIIMNKKRITGILLLAAMLLTQLGACGSSSDQPDDTDPSSDGTTPSAPADAEYVSPGVDYEGQTVTIASFAFDMSYAIAGYTMIDKDEETGDILKDSIIKMTRQVEEDLNVNLELYPLKNADRNTADTLSRLILAGEDEIQAAFPLTIGLSKLLSQPTLLMDLDTIPTLDLSHSWWDANSVEEYNIGGKQYTAVGDACFFAKSAPVVYFFNKELVENLKLDNPYQLVYDGKWTIDKMMKMATEAANDLNGNQTVEKEDRFGLICEPASLRYAMIGAGVDYSKRDGDEVEMTLFGEKAAAILEKMIPFSRDMSITMNPIDFADGTEVFETLFPPTFMDNRALFYTNQLLQALDFRAMDADFGVLPLPKYDEEQDEYYGTTNIWWQDNMIVPANNPNPEMTGHVLEALGYYSKQTVTPAFIETTVKDKSIRDDDSARMLEMIFDTQLYDVAILFDWGGVADTLYYMVADKNTDLASKYAEIEPAIKAAMKQTMDELLDN